MLIFVIATMLVSAEISDQCAALADEIAPVPLDAAIELTRTTRLSQGDFEPTEAFEARRQIAIEAMPERLFIDVPLQFGRDVTYNPDDEYFSVIPQIRTWGRALRNPLTAGHLRRNEAERPSRGRLTYQPPLDQLGLNEIDDTDEARDAIGFERRGAGSDVRGREIRLGVFERFTDPALGSIPLVDRYFALGTYTIQIPIAEAPRMRNSFSMAVEIWPRAPWVIGPVDRAAMENIPRQVAWYLSADIRCIYVLSDGEIVARQPTN